MAERHIAPYRMKNPNLATKNLADYKFNKGLPVRENCDLDDPKEMFAWCFTGPPGLNGAPIMFPSISYCLILSEHLYECGAMLKCPECGYEKPPEKVYTKPAASDPNWSTSPGTWAATPSPAPTVPAHTARQVWSQLPMNQQAELVEAILDDDGFWDRLPKTAKQKLRQIVDSA